MPSCNICNTNAQQGDIINKAAISSCCVRCVDRLIDQLFLPSTRSDDIMTQVKLLVCVTGIAPKSATRQISRRYRGNNITFLIDQILYLQTTSLVCQSSQNINPDPYLNTMISKCVTLYDFRRVTAMRI